MADVELASMMAILLAGGGLFIGLIMGLGIADIMSIIAQERLSSRLKGAMGLVFTLAILSALLLRLCFGV